MPHLGETRLILPYVPFRTFLACIESFEKGLPNRIDRSLWPSYSGAIQGQLLAAFRFLSLCDQDGVPSPELRKLIGERQNRSVNFRGIVTKSYAGLIGLDLIRTSPKQLDDAVREYGLTGATHRKAVAFFLHAVLYAGLPLSDLLRRKTRTGAFGQRRSPEIQQAKAGHSTAAQQIMTRTVPLSGGGAVTLSASVDLFAISADDRRFLFDLIDRMRAYAERHTRDGASVAIRSDESDSESG